MVPPGSDRVPPAPPYSGSCLGWQALRVRGSHPLRPAFPCGFRCARFFLDGSPTTPCAPRRPGFGLAPFRSPLLGGSLLFSFPPPTWMFRFGGFAPTSGGCRASCAAGFPIRAPADPWLLAPPRGLSRPAAPFVASVSHRHPPCALSPLARRAAHRCARARPALVSRVSCLSPLPLRFSSSRILSMNRAPVPGPTPGGGFVEDVGLEPTTPGLQSRCSSRLSQSPTTSRSPGQTRTADPHIISVVL